ncbi:CHAD domain-containing protein [Carboxylicivirga linearis]|uniref:CHAD domain-containing protein n=1 Tax=Carboxylicivirga linearis TaxID=1628157 RepID=A0ABS5JQE4_9BACT|nr:CHAD domain-containing protein [Carboxylicivirga linearis]MBS2097037.1 CHAD domain-containing protein [Carboxylicivirga linearis]
MATYRFIIDNEEELGEGVVRVASEQLMYIKQQARIPVGMDVSVHEIRKSFKRLRALLRLIRYDIGEELFLSENTKYKESAAKLSRLRDMHVIISYLATCFEAEELVITEESFIRFVGYLNEQKEREMKQLVENSVMDSIINQCKEQLKVIKEYPLSNLGPHTIHNGVIHAYKRCLDKMKAAQLNLDDEALHQLRKKVKYLYNQMLLMEAVWPDYFITYSSSLSAASELLGNDHNLAETIVIIEEAPEQILSEEEKQSLIKSITNERRHITDELWPLLGKIFAECSGAFAKRVKSYWLISRE